MVLHVGKNTRFGQDLEVEIVVGRWVAKVVVRFGYVGLVGVHPLGLAAVWFNHTGAMSPSGTLVTDMPELPEVETIRRQLAPLLPGRSVTGADSHGSEKFLPARLIVGARFATVGRRGKYLIIGLDEDHELVVHLGMTGQLLHAATVDALAPLRFGTDPHVRAEWLLDDGAILVYRDVRRFGRLRVVETGDYSSIATLATIGPEPLDQTFTAAGLHEAVSKSTRHIKTQLLSQRPVAGIGNIYADEALWAASIDPAARTISRPAAARLHHAIRSVIRSAIDNGGTTLRDYRTADGSSGSNQFALVCYGRGGEPCLRCETPLRSKVIDARTTTWCPACQRR